MLPLSEGNNENVAMTTTLTSTVMNKLLSQPIDFHCHGVGQFDFTDIPNINLQEIENILARRNQYSILTLYLPKPNFQKFLESMDVFNEGKKAGRFPHIMGFGLEGPLLASRGGTPEKGVWMPEKRHWQALANCGKKGLVYIILSPDAYLPGSSFVKNAMAPSMTWITETLLDGGVLVGPGHFTKNNPVASAKELQSIFDVVAAWGKCPTITDHFYNDMPHNFKHAWRTPEEKVKRDEEIKRLNLEKWSLETIEENLGFVPAVIIKNARKGWVKICQNFDGEHVDLAVVKRTVDLVGAGNMGYQLKAGQIV